MKKLLIISGVLISVFTSCQKDYSDEASSGAGNGEIIGADCRITKIVNADSATNKGKSALTAVINSADKVVDVTDFDSLSFTLDYNSVPVYISDTIKINSDEYFVIDAATGRVKRLHGLIDPTNPFSPPFEQDYTYDAAGYLLEKTKNFSVFGVMLPIVKTTYTWSSGNLTQMVSTDLIAGNKITDATVTYNPALSPKNFIYVFPDEDEYAEYTQFLNFGRRPSNAIAGLTVNTYDPGNVLRTTEVSTFSSYLLSRDNYVLSVIMKGNDQASLPGLAGKLRFAYKCK